jgi:hypothetical protein
MSGSGAVNGGTGALGESAGGAAHESGGGGEGGVSGEGGSSPGGESGSGASGGMGGESNAGLATLLELAKVYCQAAVSCCSVPNRPYDNFDACLQSVEQGLPKAAVESGFVVLDEAGVTACRTAIAAATDKCGAVTPQACDHIYLGTRQPGESCTWAYECAGDGNVACFLDASGSNRGACQELAHGGDGDACAGTCLKETGCALTVDNAPAAAPTACLHADGLWCNVYETHRCEPTTREDFQFCADQDACQTGECYFDPTALSGPDTYCLGSTAGCDCESGFMCGQGDCPAPRDFAHSPYCGLYFLAASPSPEAFR